MSSLYPIFLKLENRKCLVAGGGPVAERKVITLLDAGALVTVIAPVLSEKLETLNACGMIICEKRKFKRGDLKGYYLAIASTSASEVNKKIYEEAVRKGILINSVDDPANSNFFVPSSIKRGCFQVAISTSGKVPYFSKKVRQFLEKKLYKELGDDVEMLNKLRNKIIEESKNNRELKDKKFEQVLKPKIDGILKKVEKKW
ncbi:MAG: bifunctional precorrin-2 dehydrogenase/sirohydrochlorin ferrochelatase [Spirochaetes bacterium]|nr:bifunctional precorrin-2 dehydrogenase/sirohydrochlorin ferrochelatase [Spirochaetota bacterium]